MGCTDTNLNKNLKPSPAAPGIREFETGAVRSSDADSVRYDLITPIGLAAVAEVYREGFDDELLDPDLTVDNWLGFAKRSTYQFLAGGSKADLALGAVCVMEAIACKAYGDSGVIMETRDERTCGHEMIPVAALKAVAEAYAEGAVKYKPFNWESGMPVSDLLNHGLRHVDKHIEGDKTEPHLGHAAWNWLAALHSLELWPHLNADLRGPGCTPPTAGAKTEHAAPKAETKPAPINCVGQKAEFGSCYFRDNPETCRNYATDCTGAACQRQRPAAPLGGNATMPSRKCGSQLPCGDPDTCPHHPDCDWDDFDEFLNALQATGCPYSPVRPPAKRHNIPAIEDALNGRGPFPVLYLSGPMSGHRDLNFPAFNLAAEKLRRLGFPVLNPADFGANPDIEYEACLHRDLQFLGYADVLVQLPGWENSRGASLEFNTAVGLGKGVTGIHTLISDS